MLYAPIVRYSAHPVLVCVPSAGEYYKWSTGAAKLESLSSACSCCRRRRWHRVMEGKVGRFPDAGKQMADNLSGQLVGRGQSDLYSPYCVGTTNMHLQDSFILF